MGTSALGGPAGKLPVLPQDAIFNADTIAGPQGTMQPRTGAQPWPSPPTSWGSPHPCHPFLTPSLSPNWETG